MNVHDNLNTIFDIETLPVIKDTNLPVSTTQEVDMDDYTKVRENLFGLIETGKEALLDMLEVAKQSEHPRAYEVAGNLIKQIADVNKQIIDIHKEKNKGKEKEVIRRQNRFRIARTKITKARN